jgi:hypothetical protein
LKGLDAYEHRSDPPNPSILVEESNGKRAVPADPTHGEAPTDTTFFVYVATPAGEDDMPFVHRLAEQRPLALPTAVFHHSGHFRLALTDWPRMLKRGVAVLLRMGEA